MPSLINIIITIGIGSVVCALIYIGRKLQILDDLRDTSTCIGNDVADIKPKVKVLWEMNFATSKSPLVLNEKGAEILKKSGIKEIIDGHFDMLLVELKKMEPKNAYQVQECARKAMSIFKGDPAILSKLQGGAYNSGVDVDTVLFTGSLYLRDLALPKFNCKFEDLDKKSPEIK